MKRIHFHNLWEDKSNWKWSVIYNCKEDPRAIVPRRWRWGGWTLNFGHPRAGIIGLMAFGLAAGPGVLTLFLFGDHKLTFVVMLVSIIALVIWAHLELIRTD